MAKKKIKETKTNKTFAFSKSNYIFMLAGFGIIILGFILMAGGGSEDPNVFSDDIFSTRRITIAPILIIIGFIVEIYAIMKSPDNTKNTESEKTE